jgi:hypothetical protein
MQRRAPYQCYQHSIKRLIVYRIFCHNSRRYASHSCHARGNADHKPRSVFSRLGTKPTTCVKPLSGLSDPR